MIEGRTKNRKIGKRDLEIFYDDNSRNTRCIYKGEKIHCKSLS